ncbi:MAG: YggS family pyridoxal phosphate-dependent enzyme [Candidatus Omnitrophica bacterium]|nr:YggS family pyridoxal phosphate-dependent enzyme [Candidatus Omnitrophota bacterium]
MDVRENFERVRSQIERACQRSHRPAASITLIGVTKGVGLELMQEAMALGLTDVGENRVQEAQVKQAALGSRGQGPGEIRWHLVGHLQRNKAKHAVELFDVIHSVDSIALAEELERHAAKDARGSRLEAGGKNRKVLEVFVQVNVSGERTKCGCASSEARALCQVILMTGHLKLAGMMTIAPLGSHAEQARSWFRQLRQLRDEVVVTLSLEPRALSLSMGMSQDFEVAIEEGADIVRIGTAIFGPRADRNAEWGMRNGE